MKSSFLQKNKSALIGILMGATVGALYYYFIGCNSGSCLIASNPFISIPYGGLLGYLFAGIFTKKQAPKTEINENP